MPSQYTLYKKNILLDGDPTQVKTIRVYGTKRPTDLIDNIVTVDTLSFTHNTSAADTIADSASGLGNFKSGDVIQIRDDGTNEGSYLVAIATAALVTLHTQERLVTVAAGMTTTVTAVSHVEEEFEEVLLLHAAWIIAQNKGMKIARTLQARYLDAFSQAWAGIEETPQMQRTRYRG